MASNKGKDKVEEDDNNCNRNNGNNKRRSNMRLGPFPPGFKFEPTDQELVIHYLLPKVHNMELPPNNMHEIDLYDPNKSEEHNPQQLSELYEPQGERNWYFFTSRDRKYPNGKRPNRASGDGFWKASGRDEPINAKDSNGEVNQIGSKKTLVFYKGRSPYGEKTNWIMHEFQLMKKDERLINTPLLHKPPKDERIKLDDWVLCRIRYNTKGEKRDRGLKIQEPEKPAKIAKCEPSSNNPTTTAEDVKISQGDITPMSPHNVGYCPPHAVPIPPLNVTDIPSSSNSTLQDKRILTNDEFTAILRQQNMVDTNCDGFNNWGVNVTDIPSSSNSTPQDFKYMAMLSHDIYYLSQDTPHWSTIAANIPSSSNSTSEDVTIPSQNMGNPIDNTYWSSVIVTDFPSSSNSNPEDFKFTDGNFTHWSIVSATDIPSSSNSNSEDFKFTDGNFVMTVLPQDMYYPIDNTHWSVGQTGIPSSSNSTPGNVGFTDGNLMIPPQNVGPTDNPHWSALMTDISSRSDLNPEDIKFITDGNITTIPPQNVDQLATIEEEAALVDHSSSTLSDFEIDIDIDIDFFDFGLFPSPKSE